MKKLKLVAFVFAGLGFVMMVGCSKATTGPAGARGPAGPAGPDSVYHSAWVTLNMTFLGIDTALGSNLANDSVFQQSITASKITQVILDSGLVLTYFQNVDGSIVDVADYASFLDVNYSVGSVNITSYGVDVNGYQVRYVIVPGAVLTTNSILKGYTKAQLKAANYSTVVKALGIKDTNLPN
jgi:hypothetical protein